MRSRKGASAPLSPPKQNLSDSADEKNVDWPTGTEKVPALVRMRRPSGDTYLLKVTGEHLDRVLDLAKGEFGDKSVVGKD